MITCPNCGELISEETPTPVRDLVICTNCLASVVASTGARATSAETLPLTETELATLKKRRAAARNAKVQA